MTKLDEAQAKAVATYNAAADSYDAAANSFRDRFGRMTVERLDLQRGARRPRRLLRQMHLGGVECSRRQVHGPG
jgi:hypothetical protein